MAELKIITGPIPGFPGYLAALADGDPEVDPTGFGLTPEAAIDDLLSILAADRPDLIPNPTGEE